MFRKQLAVDREGAGGHGVDPKAALDQAACPDRQPGARIIGRRQRQLQRSGQLRQIANLDVINAVLNVAENGCKWRGLPKLLAGPG